MRTKILVVEDNAELLRLLRLNFRAAGFAIATATDGIEAIKKARSLAPDCVLLDLVLPELDGFAVCEILRQATETASIPIIMFTGLGGQFTRLAGLDAGANDYITKPLSPKDLVSRIKELLQLSPESAMA
jgi:DNA-binding response OmpR family regulator